MGSNQTDLELVRRIQSGDPSAFNVLVLKYQQKVINLISRYIHDSHIAEDIAQEAFIKAYKGMENFRGDSAFYTWLYRIAINTAKNHLVTTSRRLPTSDIDANEAEQYSEADALRDAGSPERIVLKDELQLAISESIEELPDDLRTAITLREIEGMSYEEIAETMNCPIGTVRSRIFRAREAVERKIRPLLT